MLHVQRWMPGSCYIWPPINKTSSSSSSSLWRICTERYSSSGSTTSSMCSNGHTTRSSFAPHHHPHHENPLTNLPEDAQIHIVSYLNCQDVIASLSTVSKSIHVLSSHPLLWKIILLRDYRYVLTQWPQAQIAFQRSSHNTQQYPTIESYLVSQLQNPHDFDFQRFYFLFSRTWVNWSIAGCNSNDRVYAGIHNSIFDLTNFMDEHPGSPETLQLYAGRDSTDFFEDIGHSLSARELAHRRQLCIVSMGYDFWKGSKSGAGTGTTASANDILPRMRSKRRRKRVPNLRSVDAWVQTQQAAEQTKANRWQNNNQHIEMFGDVNVYYDPFAQRWGWWYLDYDWKPMYMDSQ